MNDQDTELRAAALINDECYEEAYQLLLPLSDQGSEYSLMAVGWLYECGFIGEKDVDLAKSCYRRAASNGNPEAHRRLGILLDDEGHLTEARTTFETGAKLQNLGCMYELGTMLVEGKGGAVDEPKGKAWLERAAKEGHFYARRKLLSIEHMNSKSVAAKMWVKIKIGILTLRFAREYLANKDSERVV